MPVAIETVIIIIVVVSFTVLGAIVFALYWLWRLLLEDRRCTRLNTSPVDWNHRSGRFAAVIASPSQLNPSHDTENAPLTSGRTSAFPRITRGSDVIVDERSFRMSRGKRFQPPSRQANEMESEMPAEVVVLDDTEPPPPYEVT